MTFSTGCKIVWWSLRDSYGRDFWTEQCLREQAKNFWSLSYSVEFHHDSNNAIVYASCDLDGRITVARPNPSSSRSLNTARKAFLGLSLRLWHPECNFGKYYYLGRADVRVPRSFWRLGS